MEQKVESNPPATEPDQKPKEEYTPVVVMMRDSFHQERVAANLPNALADQKQWLEHDREPLKEALIDFHEHSQPRRIQKHPLRTGYMEAIGIDVSDLDAPAFEDTPKAETSS